VKNHELQVIEKLTKDVNDCFYKTLFNDPKHVILQSSEALTYQLLLDKEPSGTIHFIIEDKVAYSPARSLFGGFALSKKVDQEKLEFFYSEIEVSLKKKGVIKISIISHPNFFRKGRYKLAKFVLENRGFKKAIKYKNHHIEILGKSLQPFIHNMERRKLKKCNKAGMEFYHEPVELLPVIYNFIAVCRKEKSQPLNITMEKLSESFQKFPDNYFIFTVKKSNEIYAATIAVKVNESIFYNFLPASPVKFNAISPTVKLLDGLYTFAKKNGFKFIDLGVSTTSDGKDQSSLIKFKKHMGGKRSTKLRMEKNIDK